MVNTNMACYTKVDCIFIESLLVFEGEIMKEMADNLIIVLSRNYSTGLSVIRSLGAAGYTVDLIASAYKKGASKIAASSKYVRNSVEVVSKKVKNGTDDKLLDELLKYIGKCEGKPVIFPTDDYTTSVMDKNRKLLENYFVMPTIVGGGEECLTKCMDKTFQSQLARKAGLLTPKEWIFSLDKEIDIPEDMIYPCFCKPIESVSGYKKEMAVCQDESELIAHLVKLQKKFSERSILVQEYLEIEKEIDFSGVCVDQEIIIPAIIKKTHVAQYEKGVTLAGKVEAFSEIQRIQENIINMLKQFHYIGMFDMEFNVVGEKIYFNEVNLRSGGPNYAYYMSGVNLPALFVKAVKGESYSEEEKQVDAYGKSFVYEKVAWEDYIHGFMTRKELNSCIKSADITLLMNSDDVIPGKLFNKKMFLLMLNNKVKKSVRVNIKKTLKTIKNSFLRKYRTPLRKVKYTLLGYPQMKKGNERNPDSVNPRVIVSGRNYCSNLCMARSLGEAGYEVEVLRIFQVRPKYTRLQRYIKPEAYSKYVKAYHVCVSRRNNERIVRKLTRIADTNRKMLLIPTDDLVANVVDENYEKMSMLYLLPNVEEKSGEISRLMSKEEQKKLAENAGLPVLNSCVIKSENGSFEIPESVSYPCFIKPNISKNSSKGKMAKCENEDELRTVLNKYISKKDFEILVEDYVEIDKEFALLGVSTREGVVAPGYFVTEIGGHAERRGVALMGKILSDDQDQELRKQILSFIETLKFEGLFDVDLIKTKDGKMYFVELNLRFGASGYAVTQSGVNLPGMFADYMFYNKPIDKACKIDIPGKCFVSEKVLYEEYNKGFVDMRNLKMLMKNADIHFIKNQEDPYSFKHFEKWYYLATMVRRVGKFIKCNK